MKLKTLASLGLLFVSQMSFAAIESLEITDIYARATPPTATNSAVFMNVKNLTQQSQEIVEAQAEVAKKTELHTVEMDGDTMKMRQVPLISVAPSASVSLKPGGFHVMLLDLTQPLEEDSQINVVLTLANGESQSFDVPVKKVMSGMKHHGDMKDSH